MLVFGGLDPRVENAILDAADLGVVVMRAGHVVELKILHDNDCPHLAIRNGRRGRCRCRPDVVVPARGAA